MVRHLEVKILWIQSLCKQKRLQVWKIAGDFNIADLGTKVLAKDRFDKLLEMANIKSIKDVEKIPETKVIGGLDAGSSAPAGGERQTKILDWRGVRPDVGSPALAVTPAARASYGTTQPGAQWQAHLAALMELLQPLVQEQ